MNNKFLAIIVVILTAGIGYYFLFYKKNTLTTAQLSSLTPESISTLSEAQLATITPEQQAALTAEQQAAIAAAKAAADKAAEKAAADKAAADKAEADKLAAQKAAVEKARIDAIIQKMASISISQIKAFQSTDLASFSTEEISYFNAAQKAAFNARPGEIEKAEYWAGLRQKMSVYTADAIDKLTLAELKKFNDDELEALYEISITARSRYDSDRSALQKQEDYLIAKNNLIRDKNNLSQSDKDEAVAYAKASHDNLTAFLGGSGYRTGWYEDILKWSDAKLLYFLQDAWSMFDTWMFKTRLDSTPWGYLDKWSTNRGWDKESAERLVGRVDARIINLPL